MDEEEAKRLFPPGLFIGFSASSNAPYGWPSQEIKDHFMNELAEADKKKEEDERFKEDERIRHEKRKQIALGLILIVGGLFLVIVTALAWWTILT